MSVRVIKLSTKDAKEIEQKLIENEGYCPCKLNRTQETKCMCEDFRTEITNRTNNFICHCGLYKIIIEE